MNAQEFQRENVRLGHAIQSAVAFQMSLPNYHATQLKHVRTGLDTTKAEHGALARLLMKKGVITEEEYFDAMVEGYEMELQFQTDHARRLSGITNLSFG